VVSGLYTVRLTLDGRTQEQKVEVREDPRIEITEDERQIWTATLHEIGKMYTAANALATEVLEVEQRLEKMDDPTPEAKDQAAELHELTFELRRRLRMLYGDVDGWTGRPTEEQRAQMNYLARAAVELDRRVSALTSAQ
jgi:hypothetical protein